MSLISAKYLVDLTGRGVDPDSISRRTGLAPTWVIREGQPSPFGARTHSRATSWSIRVELDAAHEIEQAIDRLLSSLAPAWASLIEIGREYPVWVSVTVVPSRVVPALTLPTRILEAMAELGARLDIDLQVDLGPRPPGAPPSPSTGRKKRAD